ncbi:MULTISPECIES: hypothetical protein [Olleya]|uniref:DUF4142 domain-containing protein n=1 Tax=Olleya namhaensis TaxID=1144750 RepID=A0A1I3S8N4_9FLAO|nr:MULTISPECIES: hypothetical protein [Olleya]PKG50755.1 hypothetical protein CXF54_11400 [Olleya sp. 1-3]SFJ54750.1 hypothetical protein SAMN05443431_10978 [Olleya namhaensis]
MKYLKNRRFTVVLFFTVLLIALSFNSCDEFIKSKSQQNKETEQTQQTIATNKNEAKLLLMLSKDNQDVIHLSKKLQHVVTKDSAVALIKKIEETHIEIAEAFNTVATNKLISIPNYSEISPSNIVLDSSQENKIKALQKLKAIIDNQLFLLDKLSKTTNSKTFKKLIVKADSKINDSLTRTKNIINTLNTNS